MKLKIGDRVKINKKKALFMCSYNKRVLPEWYCDEIYAIKNIDEDRVTLDRDLPNNHGCDIHIVYLKSLKKERKKKLLKLNSL